MYRAANALADSFLLWHKNEMKLKNFLKKSGRRTGLVLVEIVIVTAVLGVIAFAALSWRLLSGPLEVAFAKPYILEALHDEQSGIHASMDKVVLFWPDLREPILLGLQNAAVYDKNGNVLAAIDEAALGFNKAQLFFGRLRPENLVLRRPSLSVTRNEDNSLEIGLADLETYGPKVPEENETDIAEEIMKALNQSEDMRSSSPLAYLKSVEVEGAKILIDDKALDLSWVFPRTNAVIERSREGFAGRIEVGLSEDLAASGLNMSADFNRDTGLVSFDTVLENFNLRDLGEKLPDLSVLAAQDVLLNAQLQGSYDLEHGVRNAKFVALSEQGALQIEELSVDPVIYNDFGVTASYNGAEGQLDVQKIQIALGDVPLSGSASFKIAEKIIDGNIRGDIAEVKHAGIVPLWPVALEDDSSKEWIIDKLSNGTFSNAYVQTDIKADLTQDAPDVSIANMMAGFEFTDMDIDYRAPLKPIKGASGKGVFDYNADNIQINVSDAQLLDLAVSDASVLLSDVVAEGKGDAVIELKLVGPAKSVLTYVKDEPIGVETDIKVDEVKGNAALGVKISLPTQDDVKVEDVKVDVEGTITDAYFPNVVRGLALSEGPFDLKIKDNLLRVSGKGRVSGEPAQIEYQEYLVSKGAPFSSKVKASLMATQAMREKFGIDLSVFLSGRAFVDVDYTKYTDGRGEALVKADIGPSKLYIDPFDYVKPAGEKGEITVKAVLKDDNLLRLEQLRGTSPNLVLEPSVLRFRSSNGEDELSGGNIPRFVLGDTVGSIEFEITPAGLTKIILNGPFLDARPFLNDDEDKKDEPYSAPPLQISVTADKMRTDDEAIVTGAKLYMDIDGGGKFNQLEMDARAGQGDIYLRFKPDGSGKRVFRLEADDAGATLMAFGLYDDIRGGKLKIYAEPKGGLFDRNLFGKAEMSDFRVVRAPTLAKLMSAMSLGGMTQALNNDGLVFSKMAADFEWRYRPEGSLLVLKDGRTSGNTLGLSFDGTFDNAAQTLDVKGTIIPLSGVNKMIGDIPLVGDILTGGTGALIAATYTMTGQSHDPKVSVNPLSVLTPGFLRRILFEQ